MTTNVCIYCGALKDRKDLSDEHIWPSALGGDALPAFWRTNHVCQTCNAMSGVFVDGEFVKGVAGAIEGYTGIDFVNVDDPSKAVFPLAYLGRFTDAKVEDGQQAEYWAGPCGANVIHLRPADREPIWSTYVGGDPRRQRQGGRVYLSLTSNTPFWLAATLRSVSAHFKRQRSIYIVNAGVPDQLAPKFRQPDPTDEQQSKDLGTVQEITITRRGQRHHMQMIVAKDTGSRFLSKVALAIGYKTFGSPFLDTSYAMHLRQGFREANPQRRRNIPVRGVGYLGSPEWPQSLHRILSFRGVWVLAVLAIRSDVCLLVVTPSGSPLLILITDERELVPVANYRLDDGVVWVVVPTLGEAIGPIEMPDYLAHQSGSHSNDQLAALEEKRVNRSDLPPC